ncbi:hypothetical protein J1N35_008072 [Gossypium stocksii]|uniref:Uncharacterized protein n=1 Tax=Gossypium stocksii TaxID=47602 RepID=A0A9D3W7I5_9ROSI|nr:hypothetical protein J1N35_008072 [Gossypium stocksii]
MLSSDGSDNHPQSVAGVGWYILGEDQQNVGPYAIFEAFLKRIPHWKVKKNSLMMMEPGTNGIEICVHVFLRKLYGSSTSRLQKSCYLPNLWTSKLNLGGEFVLLTLL